MGFLCSVLLYSLLKICLKSYSVVFNGNCSMKPSNIALLLVNEKKQMFTRSSKFSSEFPPLKGFGLITRINIHLHMRVLT